MVKCKHCTKIKERRELQGKWTEWATVECWLLIQALNLSYVFTAYGVHYLYVAYVGYSCLANERLTAIYMHGDRTRYINDIQVPTGTDSTLPNAHAFYIVPRVLNHVEFVFFRLRGKTF